MRALFLLFSITSLCWPEGRETTGFHGRIRDSSGAPVSDGIVTLRSNGAEFSAKTDEAGEYRFGALKAASYTLTVQWKGRQATCGQALSLPNQQVARIDFQAENSLNVRFLDQPAGSGGEDVGTKVVSAIPLNKRDFSQILLLAAGTMTDANGATNFTAQFAINGQRGVEAVFAIDGADSSDPEMGGATFSNFNVDAVAEIQSSSGWMPAQIGHGAAGFTDIITRSGSNAIHGSLFEFIRNSALDARNFFDRRSAINPGRIPPFRRNEFGFALGGPLSLPKIYEGHDRTFFYVQYQGFRQVLGTTQVIPVPSLNERAGMDVTAFPGDPLYVPVDPRITKILNRYPLPNDPGGPFGSRTFAGSSPIRVNADQFSGRVDHKLTSKDSIFARFSADNLHGPTTNPDQTVIDPSFGITYIDHQRNAVLNWTRASSPRFTSESSISFTRTTPSFPTSNHTDPAVTFGDGLYEPFNLPGGSVTASFGNLFQARQTSSWTIKSHTIKAGGEFRGNRDTTYFGQAPNGSYTFGGGAAYASVNIPSASGLHNIAAGSPLPDTLSGFLSGSAFAYTVAVAPPNAPQGSQIGVAAVSRCGVNLFAQDDWKISDRFQLEYGLRYELYTPITERAHRSAGVAFVRENGALSQNYLINPQPPYRMNAHGWGPRMRLSWQAAKQFTIHFGGGLTTIPPNIWQDNLLTGAAPYVDYPRLTAASGSPLLYGTSIGSAQLPGVYTPTGVNIFAAAQNNSKAVPPNTVWDVTRFAQELAALSPGHQISPLNVNAISQDFRNAYLATWTASLERQFSGLNASAAYVGTAGISLPAINFPNGYPGATPNFAPFTMFDSTGQPTGGFGTESLMTNRSHSSYHALQTSIQGTVPRGGPSIQASYTFGKSLDDGSTVIGGFVSGASGAAAPAWPQNPFDTRGEKGLSSFDVRHAFSLNAIQDLPLRSLSMLDRIPTVATAGWELLSVVTLTSGSPFTIYSGVQQTGAGSNGVDRPDQVGVPDLSTARKIREDYFGLGANNASYFSIPIHQAGGTGPNNGYFGTLGRNTFRGPSFHNFDFALIKNTGLNRAGIEFANLQFRAEFFNLFNIVNFGLPANILEGSGFGQINRTAGSSRQIQFSLKVMF